MAVAGDHLGRRHRTQAERLAHMTLDLGRDVRVGADGTTELHHRHVVAGSSQPGAIAIDLERPQRHLGTEGRRLGVDSVRATDHHRVAVFAGDPQERGEQLGRGLDQQVGGIAQRPAQRRVDHVGRRQPVVDPRRSRRADRSLYDVDERGDVVIGDRLTVEHGLHERLIGDRRLPAAGLRIIDRNDPERCMTFGGEQLDLEPATETNRVAPHRVHLGRGVARDHDAQTR